MDKADHAHGGPLAGVKVLDVSALGPGPFASMLLADHGADVVSVSRPTRASFDPAASFSRGKRSIVVDLRAPGGADVIRGLAKEADVFLESFRPGVMERRGLGPDVLLADNPGLIYTRLTGYGQDGPYANRAGHDLNYLATAGTLGVVGTGAPVPPLNLLGDFASGSLMAVQGVLLALFERQRTGLGQVLDVAMLDGAALLTTAQLAEHSDGTWGGRGSSVLSGTAPYYGVYECSDGGWFAVGAIEPQFYSAMVTALGLVEDSLPDRRDQACWPELRTIIGAVFASRTRGHWAEVFASIDGCGNPVLDLGELTDDEHVHARQTVAVVCGRLEARPAPRLSLHEGVVRVRPAEQGIDTRVVLAESGWSDAAIDELVTSGTVVQS